MSHKRKIVSGVLLCTAMLILILDAKTALTGARDGISLCLYTVVPALFPFFILSLMLSSRLLGKSIRPLHPVSKLCGIPIGAESLLLLGLLGGYPVGAQCIFQAYENKQLDRTTAHRLLGFCSNAGPAFIFGMVSSLFSSPYTVWFLWLIHIVSAVLVGIILPGKTGYSCKIASEKPLNIQQSVQKSIRILAGVCGWVIIFRVILAFMNSWFLWLLPQEIQVFLIGLTELSNGCVALRSLPSEGIRFVFSACMLGMGGICVGMQTVSVTKHLGPGAYFPGKLLQGVISFILADLVWRLIGSDALLWNMGPVIVFSVAVIGILFALRFQHRKKVVAMFG